MKNVKKIVLAASLCAAMAATAAFGTLAYFTDTKEADNTFTAGNLSITLTEQGWDNGNRTDGKNDNLVPGRTVAKEPVVTVNADSVPSYVRLVVEMPKEVYQFSNFDTENTVTPEKIIFRRTGGDALSTAWTKNEKNTDVTNDTVRLVFDYNDTITNETPLDALFGEVYFDGSITNATTDDAYQAMKDFNVKVSAYATQQEGFQSVDEAFADSFTGVFIK